MPSLFETIGVVVVAGTTAATFPFDPSLGLMSRVLVASVSFVFCAATFLGFRALWVRSHFDEPPAPRQTARGYLLYLGMPLCVLAVGGGVSLLAQTATRI